MQSVVVLKFDSKVGLLVCKIDHSNQPGLVSAHFPSLLQTLIGMALSEKLKAILLEISLHPYQDNDQVTIVDSKLLLFNFPLSRSSTSSTSLLTSVFRSSWQKDKR